MNKQAVIVELASGRACVEMGGAMELTCVSMDGRGWVTARLQRDDVRTLTRELLLTVFGLDVSGIEELALEKFKHDLKAVAKS